MSVPSDPELVSSSDSLLAARHRAGSSLLRSAQDQPIETLPGRTTGGRLLRKGDHGAINMSLFPKKNGKRKQNLNHKPPVQTTGGFFVFNSVLQQP